MENTRNKNTKQKEIYKKAALAENVMLMGFGVTNKVRMERKQIPFDTRTATDDRETNEM